MVGMPLLPSSPQQQHKQPQSYAFQESVEINAPITVVWEHLSDLEEWYQWNPSIRLPCDATTTVGQWGKAKIAVVCNRRHRRHHRNPPRKEDSCNQKPKQRWMAINCVVESMVGNQNQGECYSLIWTTRRGLVKNTTCMKLNTSVNSSRKTLLTYTQQTIHSTFFLGRIWHGMTSSSSSSNSSPRDRKINAACINQCFKNHVECLHFQSLFLDASNRNMTTTTKPKKSALTSSSSSQPSKSSSPINNNVKSNNPSLVGPNNSMNILKSNHVRFSDDHVDNDDEVEEEEMTAVDSEDFWTSSANIRNAVVAQLVEEAVLG